MNWCCITYTLLRTLTSIQNMHCIKSVPTWSFSGPQSPYSVQMGKIRTRKTLNTDTFHTVMSRGKWKIPSGQMLLILQLNNSHVKEEPLRKYAGLILTRSSTPLFKIGLGEIGRGCVNKSITTQMSIVLDPTAAHSSQSLLKVFFKILFLIDRKSGSGSWR